MTWLLSTGWPAFWLGGKEDDLCCSGNMATSFLRLRGEAEWSRGLVRGPWGPWEGLGPSASCRRRSFLSMPPWALATWSGDPCWLGGDPCWLGEAVDLREENRLWIDSIKADLRCLGLEDLSCRARGEVKSSMPWPRPLTTSPSDLVLRSVSVGCHVLRRFLSSLRHLTHKNVYSFVCLTLFKIVAQSEIGLF